MRSLLPLTPATSRPASAALLQSLVVMVLMLTVPAPVEAEEWTDPEPAPAPAEIAETPSLPMYSRSYELAMRRLPQTFRMVQTDRFVLLSDADALRAAEHGRWIERACAEFQRFAGECGLEPRPLRHKLVCVLFDRDADYKQFARAHDGMTNPAFTGYYSPKNDRVVFSLEPEASIVARPESKAAESAERSSNGKPVLGFDDHERQAAAEDSPAGGAAAMPAHVCAGDGAAKCVHETIHQLMFHTGLMKASVQYPLWICEGLSTAFETTMPENVFGPDVDFKPRRDMFKALLDRDDLIPLRDLVRLSQLGPSEHRLTRIMYHQSYALVTWMCRHRKAELREYLRLMVDEPAGKLSGPRHLQLFEIAFGEVEALEEQWLAHERVSPLPEGLESPLHAHDVMAGLPSQDQATR